MLSLHRMVWLQELSKETVVHRSHRSFFVEEMVKCTVNKAIRILIHLFPFFNTFILHNIPSYQPAPLNDSEKPSLLIRDIGEKNILVKHSGKKLMKITKTLGKLIILSPIRVFTACCKYDLGHMENKEEIIHRITAKE